jgi:hypothetical protein
MKIDSIKIGPVTYAVTEVEDLHTHDDDGKRQWLHGEIRWANADIRVCAHQAHDRVVTTLWHEAVHGILEAAGQEHDESAVTALGFGLVQLVRDNPALIALTVGNANSD